MAGYLRHPPLVPPLYPPSYTEKCTDVETTSIRSANSSAPSYVSDRPPPYRPGERVRHDLNISNPAAATGRDDFAEDRHTLVSTALETPTVIEPRGSTSLQPDSDFWSASFEQPMRGPSQSNSTPRQRQTIVFRRQNEPSCILRQSATLPSQIAHTETSGDTTPPAPFRPLEDAALVGDVAARLAREQRLYRESCTAATDALQQESVSWDFLLGQMADWEERERGWARYRREVTGGKKRFGRRVLGTDVRFVTGRDGV